MFGTFEELRKAVEANGGLMVVTMYDLREAHGAAKLGVHVRREISGGLAAVGLGHFPHELPSYQEEKVRVFRRGTPIADLVDAVLSPSDFGDERLREAGGNQATEILKEIRQLVCE